MAFCFKNTKKDIIMTEKKEEDFRIKNICWFSKKELLSDKICPHCHLTGKNRGQAHNTCIINFTQDQSNFKPFKFHIFIIFYCHLNFKKLDDKKNDKVNFKIKPKTNEEYTSVKNGCIRLIDSYMFLSSTLDPLVKTLVDNSH